MYNLSLDHGRYTLSLQGFKVKIVVDYAGRKFAYRLIGRRQIPADILSQIQAYVQNFAQEMIDGKSARNFFDAKYLQVNSVQE